MSASPAAQRLRRIADALAEGRLPLAEDCREHALGLQEAMNGVPLSEALALRGRWWAGLASELLWAAIVRACEPIDGYGAPRSDNKVAAELRRRLKLYASGQFRFDSQRGEPSDGREALFAVLSLNGSSIPSSSTIRAALRDFSNCQANTALVGNFPCNIDAHEHHDETQTARGRDRAAS